MDACDACVRRTWLLQRLGGYLEFQRSPVELILGLDDLTLIDCWLEIAEKKGRSDDVRTEYGRFSAARAEAARAEASRAGLELLCRCDPVYPARLRELHTPPAVLHVAGGMERFLALANSDLVAIIGTRRPTLYGTEVARLLGRGTSVSGLSVVSGMAIGVDAAAHRGALAGSGRTIAVLPGCAAEPYPKANRQLYDQILRAGVAVSELGPGARVHKWTLIARNRIVAALAELVVVVQAKRRSGALRTVEFAESLGRRLGAVPGSVLVSQSEGPHALLRAGAVLIDGTQDILDAICGVGERNFTTGVHSGLSDRQRRVLDAIAGGADTLAALDGSGAGGDSLLMLLAELELAGCVRRSAGGRYLVIA